MIDPSHTQLKGDGAQLFGCFGVLAKALLVGALSRQHARGGDHELVLMFVATMATGLGRSGRVKKAEASRRADCSCANSLASQAYAFLRPMLEMLLILPSSDASASWWSHLQYYIGLLSTGGKAWTGFSSPDGVELKQIFYCWFVVQIDMEVQHVEFLVLVIFFYPYCELGTNYIYIYIYG